MKFRRTLPSRNTKETKIMISDDTKRHLYNITVLTCTFAAQILCLLNACFPYEHMVPKKKERKEQSKTKSRLDSRISLIVAANQSKDIHTKKGDKIITKGAARIICSRTSSTRSHRYIYQVKPYSSPSQLKRKEEDMKRE